MVRTDEERRAQDRERHRRNREENPEKVRDRERKNRQNNSERVRAWDCARSKKKREENPEKVRDYYREYRKRRYHTDPSYRLSAVLRSRLSEAIANNQKAGSAVRDLGCTIPELKSYLEAQFRPGMSWDNWAMHGWHIDHIIPMASFDLTDPAQVKIACHFTNLQPLWAAENMSKGARHVVD